MADNKKSAGGTAIPSAENNKNISISIIEQAKEKIKTSSKVVKLNKKAEVIKDATLKALHQFCEQSEEFSRAVIDCDKPFEVCLNEIIKGTGNAISDLDVFNKAVQFYFPGAVVEFRMLIHMSKYELDEPEQLPSPKPIKQPKDNINLSLDSLLDW
jgi:hypothetical protein